MTTILICLLIGTLYPYVLAFATVPFRSKQFDGDIGLAHPRAQATQLTGAGARIRDAQDNAWEAITVFGVANLAAFMAGVSMEGNWKTAALVWVVARGVHGLAYGMGIAGLRVLAFGAGLGMSVWILVMAIQAAG